MELNKIYSPIARELEVTENALLKEVGDLAFGYPAVNAVLSSFFSAPGQKLRPALVLLSARAAAEDDNVKEEQLILLAVIVELIHSASLIHDDVIDRAETRRKRPSINHQFGSKVAVLAGDTLYAQAFALLIRNFDRKIMKILSACVQKMCIGEINEGREHDFDQYLKIIEDKTAVFMSACCQAGAALISSAEGRRPTEEIMSAFGMNFGLVYQIMDDLRDNDVVFTGTPAGLKRMREKLEFFNARAKGALEKIPGSCYRAALEELLSFIFGLTGERKKAGETLGTA